ncbi:MAG: type IX secretion system membrane protein PorP/SprF [Bacteroidales bacterium]|nr:type IX secretion system membrane protein PorP/SprF [Bacteroidales bacterium]
MKKVLLLSIGLLLFVFSAFTQVQLTQYFLDGTLYNPAFAGSQGAFCANIYGRQQWISLKDENGNKISPLSVVFNLNAPITTIHSGIGVNVVYNKAGFEQTIGLKVNYAYRIPLKNVKNSLGIGLAISLSSKSIDFSQLTLEQPNDPLLKIKQKESGFIPDFDFGIQYQQLKKIYMGLSGTNLLESYTDIGNVNYGQKRNFYLTGGYYIKLMEKQKKALYLIPSALVKSNLINVQFDISARVEYNDLFWAGVSYRYQDAVAVLAGLNIEGFRIGASYDFTTSYLSQVSGGSAEIFLGYCFKIKSDHVHTVNPKVKLNSLYNTRYL